jgi:hypothetical protein
MPRRNKNVGRPRVKKWVYEPMENRPVIYLCPVPVCSQPLVRRDGLIVCQVDSEHYTQEVIQKWE